MKNFQNIIKKKARTKRAFFISEHRGIGWLGCSLTILFPGTERRYFTI